MPSKFLIRLCAIKVLMHRKQDLPQVDKDDHQGESTSVRIVLKTKLKKTRIQTCVPKSKPVLCLNANMSLVPWEIHIHT